MAVRELVIDGQDWLEFDCPVGEEFVLMGGEMVPLTDVSGRTYGMWLIGWASGREYPIFPEQMDATIRLEAARCALWMDEPPAPQTTP